jgi:predicted AlkP superfamily phosphohydrolase/phosphomutase
VSAAPRVLFVGLDAASPDLIDAWIDGGQLPMLARLRDGAIWGRTRNPSAVYTGAVWPCFLTGTSPGRHGCYYEDQVRPGTYRIDRVLPEELGHEPFWNELARAGRRVCAFDVPKSFVTPDGAAVQLCNWGTHDAETVPHSWPPELASEVATRFGSSPFRRCDWVARGPDPEERLVAQLLHRIDVKVKIAEELLDRERWDLFLLGFGDSHCAGHQLWHLHDPSHPRHDAALAERLDHPLLRIYRALDGAVGRVLSRAGPETTTIVLCSHGMASHYDATYLLDDVLRRIEGSAKPSSRAFLDRARSLWRRLPVRFTERFTAIARHVHELPDSADRQSRRCFAVPTNANAAGIRINLVGREPAGRVRPGAERERFEEELVAELHALVNPDTGGPLVREVIRSADAFPGERSEHLPDLFVRWNRESPIRGAASPRIGLLLREDKGRRSGDHRPDGLFLVRRPDARPGRLDPPVAVEDFAPTIAALLGCSLRDVDGAPVPALVGP